MRRQKKLVGERSKRNAKKNLQRSELELLEVRRMLSVAASTMVGQFLTAGSSYDYVHTFVNTTTGDTTVSDATKTIEGPATSPGGDSSTLLYATFSTGAVATNNTYIGLTSAGFVQYETDSTQTNSDTDDESYSPANVIIPASLTAGVPVEESTTQSYTDTSYDDQGNPTVYTGSEEIDDVFTLNSQQTQAVTVPAGTFQAYQVTDVETTYSTGDGDDGSSVTNTYYWAPNIGPIEEVTTTDFDTNTFAMSGYKLQDVLKFASQPANASIGTSIPSFSVEFTNPDGTVDTSNNSSITLALQGGDGTLSGTATATAVNGVATFSNLSIDKAGTYTLSASSSNAFGTTASSSFTVGSSALTWTGGGDGTSWSDPKNWDGDVAPQSGDSLVFPSGSPLNPNNDIAGLTLNSIDIQGSGYTLAGNSISLTGSLTSEAGNNTYDINTTLVGSPTLDDQTGDLTINADLTGDNLTLEGSGTFTLDQSDGYTGDTTLDGGVTIDDDTAQAFGDGDISIAAGSAAVSIDGSSTPAQIDNDITFQNGATLETDPTVVLGGTITVPDTAFLGATNPTDTLTLAGGAISGTGTLTIIGKGVDNIADPVASTVVLQLNSGQVNLQGALQGTGTQVIDNGAATDLHGASGTGGIDVKSGVFSSGTMADTTYSGTITLESGGELDVADPADGEGFGVGTLELNGGTLLNATVSSGSTAVEIDNDISLNGTVTVTDNSGGSDEQNLFLGGTLTATSASTLTLGGGGALFLKSVTGEQVNFDGTGSYVITGGISGPVDFENTGTDDLGGAISAGDGATGTLVLVDGADTVVQLMNGTETVGGESLTGVSNTGGIEVMAGTLVSDEGTGASGIASYSGMITLDAGGTLKYYDTTQDGTGFGTGTLDLKGGTLQNSSAVFANITNPVTIDGNVTFVAPATGGSLEGAASLYLAGTTTVPSAQTLTVNGDLIGIANLTGAGPLTVNGSGSFSFVKSVSAPLILTGSVRYYIGGAVTSGVTINDANTVAELVAEDFTGNGNITPLTGTGSIEVQNGTLASDESTGAPGIPNYSGTITLEADGTLKYYDTTQDGTGFGTGTLDLKGGTLQNSSAVFANITNPVTIDGNVTFVAPATGGSLEGAASLYLAGTTTVPSAQTLTVNGDLIGIANLTGAGPLTVNGSGSFSFVKSVSAPLILTGSVRYYIGGAVTSGVTINDANTVAELVAEDFTGNGNITPLTGTGSIEVQNGTLASDESEDSSGIPGFSGNITLDPNGTIKNFDAIDTTGLGTGTLTLTGGLLQNAGVNSEVIGNPINVTGSVTVSSTQFRLKFYNTLSIQSGSSLSVVGSLVLDGSLTGSGSIQMNGDLLAVATSNPSFTGTVTVTSGTIDVVQDDALGSGDLTAALTGQGVLQQVDSVGDPILDNPLIIQSGTLVIEGDFTFPAGITIDTGTDLTLDDAQTSVVDSGPLSGGGDVVTSGGTFTASGSTSGFTGAITSSSTPAQPIVTTNPTGQSVTAGQTATFTAAASGNPPPTVQWQVSTDGGKTFSNINGAISDTYSFTSAAAQNGDEYQAVFTNSVNTATTTAATLTVSGVISPPVTNGSLAGSSSVAVTTGYNLTSLGTSDWTQFGTGADASAINRKATGGDQISNLTQVGPGNYGAFVSPSYQTEWSDGAPLSSDGNEHGYVWANNAIGAGYSFTAPADTTTRTLYIYVGGFSSGSTLTAHLSDGSAADYSVSFSGSDHYYDIVAITYQAASANQKLIVTYTKTSNINGTAGSADLIAAWLGGAPVAPVATAPVPVVNPRSQSVTVGTDVQFTASATGTPTPTVQWYVSTDGGKTFVGYAGGITDTIDIGPATLADNGNQYEAIFTNSAGYVVTSIATLTVNPAPTGGSLSGSASVAASSYNVSTLGTSDWAVFGAGGSASGFDHKATGGSQISNVTRVGSGQFGGYSDQTGTRSVSWTGGMPASSYPNDTGYLWANNGIGAGYSFTAPASTTARTIYLYLGGNSSGSTLTAHLSDGSAADYTVSFSNAGTYNEVVAITYQAASANQTLTLTYVKSQNINGTNGSIDLMAAWLA